MSKNNPTSKAGVTSAALGNTGQTQHATNHAGQVWAYRVEVEVVLQLTEAALPFQGQRCLGHNEVLLRHLQLPGLLPLLG